MQHAFPHNQRKEAEKRLSEDYFSREGTEEGRFSMLLRQQLNTKSLWFKKLPQTPIAHCYFSLVHQVVASSFPLDSNYSRVEGIQLIVIARQTLSALQNSLD